MPEWCTQRGGICEVELHSTKREQGCIIIKGTEEMEKRRKCPEVM